MWARWRAWRRGRPFWGGLLAVVSGVEIGLLPLAPMKVMLHQGTAGLLTVVLAAIVVVLGLSGVFTPQHRQLAGIITVILATAALVLSNLGGFFFGTLLGVIGGALMFAWRPDEMGAPGDEPADADSGARTGVVTAALASEAPDSLSVPTARAAEHAPSGSKRNSSRTPGTSRRKARPAEPSLAEAFGVDDVGVEDDEPFPPSRG
jgi:Family of unknown function (DUF6114)